jgi:hypothetical protein
MTPTNKSHAITDAHQATEWAEICMALCTPSFTHEYSERVFIALVRIAMISGTRKRRLVSVRKKGQ